MSPALGDWETEPQADRPWSLSPRSISFTGGHWREASSDTWFHCSCDKCHKKEVTAGAQTSCKAQRSQSQAPDTRHHPLLRLCLRRCGARSGMAVQGAEELTRVRRPVWASVLGDGKSLGLWVLLDGDC